MACYTNHGVFYSISNVREVLVVSPQSASLFPRINSAIFVESALPSPRTNLSLYLLGCFLAGVWFVRLESWQTVADHADPPQQG